MVTKNVYVFPSGTEFALAESFSWELLSPPSGSEDEGFVVVTRRRATEIYGDYGKFRLAHFHPDRVDFMYPEADLEFKICVVLGWIMESGWHKTEVPE